MSLVVQITQDEAGSQTLPGGRRGKGGEEEEGGEIVKTQLDCGDSQLNLLFQLCFQFSVGCFVTSLLLDVQLPVVLDERGSPVPHPHPHLPYSSRPTPGQPVANSSLNHHRRPLPCNSPPTLAREYQFLKNSFQESWNILVSFIWSVAIETMTDLVSVELPSCLYGECGTVVLSTSSGGLD